MILRKLSIFGFKSFADKTELCFSEGMTAVVGPNGCGKTNVVDAIRWVFGEQKTSVLRSAHMQDVIFSGSEKRQPLNMAEVTLTISNTRGILPVEYNEVAITRRIFRSGDSDYLINRTACRLRDIHNLFLDTGVGSNAYTTIENSMINRILSDKAEERRILFEEAAGIGKYKQRIKESQRKLDRTRQDLLRINDRVQEKERYVRMLGRQVEKAKRYKQYHDDLQALEVGFENRRYTMLEEKLKEIRRMLAEMDSEIATLKAKVAAGETRIEKMELSKVEKENEVQIAGRNVSDASERINALEREVSVSQQSVSILKQNVTRFENELESFDSQNNEKKDILSNIEKSIISRETQLEEMAGKVTEARDALSAFDARMQEQRQYRDELAVQQLNCVRMIGEKQRELSTVKTNLSNCIERCERDESELKKLEDHLEESRMVLENCRQQLAEVNESFKNHMRAREKLWNRIEEEDEHYHAYVEREKSIESRIDSGKAKLRFLEGLDAAFEGYGDGVKSLLEKNLPGTMGIVADLIEVENAEMVPVVERALGSVIQTVVFKTDADLTAAMEYLNTEKLGVARMVSLERLQAVRHNAPSFVVNNSLPLRVQITTEEECNILADYLFNRVLICDNDSVALQLQPQVEAGTTIVSHDGAVCYANGSVVAGTKKTEQVGILQRKQEIEQLKEEYDRLQNELNTVIHDKEICIITRDEAKRALIEIDEKLNTGRQRQQEQETNIKHYEAEIENLRERAQSIVPGLEKNRNSIDEFRWLIKEHEVGCEEIVVKRQQLEEQIGEVKNRLEEMDAERTRLSEHLKNIQLSEQGLASRVEQDKNSVEHLKQDILKLGDSRQKKIEDKNSALSEIKDLEEKLVVLKESIERQTSRREELQKVLENVREDFNALLNTIEEQRRENKVYQKELEAIAERRHTLEVEQTRDDEQKRAIREKIYNAYEIDLASPPDDIPEIDMEDAEVAENIHVLKERLRRVGEVNMGAIGEYEQESTELKEMVMQRDDLQKAVDDLEKAIRKLNREARIQFIETFERVQNNFREMFTTLFEGGEASLSLEEDADPLYAEIKINARPAGKKMRGVTLLSGGERALTAISLLFALYLVKPSAYCILDELDAPLDDANIDRFIRVLKKFAQRTQFIIITHNKHTMEAADLLYGVTQQESGISTVASVTLGEDRRLKAA